MQLTPKFYESRLDNIISINIPMGARGKKTGASSFYWLILYRYTCKCILMIYCVQSVTKSL